MQNSLKSSVAARLLTPLLAWACLAGVGLLAGCGQKGPLTLQPPANAASAPAR